MGAGMIFGKKSEEGDSDLYFWEHFAEVMGDSDILETVRGMMAQQAKNTTAPAAAQPPPAAGWPDGNVEPKWGESNGK